MNLPFRITNLVEADRFDSAGFASCFSNRYRVKEGFNENNICLKTMTQKVLKISLLLNKR